VTQSEQHTDEKKAISWPVVVWLLRCADLAAIAGAGLVAHYLRFNTFVPRHEYLQAYLFVTIAAPFIFHSFAVYDRQRISQEPMQLQRLGVGLVALVFFTLAVGFLTKTSIEFSRIWMSIWGLLAILSLVSIRLVLWIKYHRWKARGLLSRRIAVVGAGTQGQRVVRYFAESGNPSLVLIGVFDDRRTRIPNQIGDVAVRGTVDELLEVVQSERVDEVIVALPWSAEGRLLELLQKLRSAPTQVRLSPGAIAYRFPNRPADAIDGVGMLSVYQRAPSEWSRVIKRIQDLSLSVVFLIIFAPLFLGISLAIKLTSRGPVLIRSRHYDFDNKPFEAISFRTRPVAKNGSDKSVEDDAEDNRGGWLGWFLRDIGLDRLPQIFNVLRGEMSIVGPQALNAKSGSTGSRYEEIVAEYFARHRVKPGVTGWAQVHGLHGGGDTHVAIERRIEFDLDYIERWSFLFDLKIIMMTPFAMFIAPPRD
jgi:Undecaprenyl-phosphate glucose phosphotransferase